MSVPLISVIMPVHNGADYIAEAIASILAQSLADFELLVLDDGSTDRTPDIVAALAAPEPRIVLLTCERRGLIATLNDGLARAEGQYIARMDADDIALPERFARQAAYFDAHPEVGILGTWYQRFGGAGSIARLPTESEEIRCTLLFENALCHPSVMMRRAFLRQFQLSYPAGYAHAEDYALWVQAAACFPLANLPEILLHYRIHSTQVVSSNRVEKDATAARIHGEQLQALGIEPSDEQRRLHEAICMSRVPESVLGLDAYEHWLLQLLQANARCRRYPVALFERLLGARWFRLCYLSTRHGLPVLARYHRSPLRRCVAESMERYAKFCIKSIMRRP